MAGTVVLEQLLPRTLFFRARCPHFHVRYAEHDASISIETLEVLGGSLPRRALGFAREWARLHQNELKANWERARAEAPLEEIDPLP